MEAIDCYEPGRTLRGIDELSWMPKSKYLVIQEKRAKKRELDAEIIGYQKSTPKLAVCGVATDPLYEKFKRLLSEWQEESMLMSSLTDMVMLQSYRAIIGMGPAAVRLILNELKHEPDYLFSALEAITEVNPVLSDDEGNLERMANDWIEWGRKEGVIA